MAFTDFDEMNGSPILDIYVDRQTARRWGKITWSSTNSLISHLFPTDGSPPASFSSSYPSLRAAYCHIEPLIGDKQITGSSGLNIDTVNSYGEAKATIEYAVDSRYHEIEDTPEEDPVIRLTHRWSTGGEFLTVPSKGWEWSDGDDVDEDVEFGLLVPTVEHQITWPRIESPPFSTIRDSVGKINSQQMDFKTGTISTETLLFLGAELSRDVLSNGSLGWEVTYRFSEKKVSAKDGGAGGWNHFYRNDDESTEGADDAKVGFYGVQEKYVSGSDQFGPYRTIDLNNLFQEDP